MGAIISLPTSDYIPESSTAVVGGQLEDENGDNISSGGVSAITATLLNDIGAVVNARSQQDVLNTNDGTLSADGFFELELQVADTAIREAGPEYQQFALAVTAIHSGGKTSPMEITFYIRKLKGHP